MIPLQRAMIDAWDLPEGSMLCGPSMMQGYVAIHIPLTAEVMRLLADAMDNIEVLAKESKQ